MRVSVIIPTYNRPQTLLRAIRSLQEQEWQDSEILVVDNAADAGIEYLVVRSCREAKIPVHYIPEPSLGLHNARHAGAHAASGEILVFTDDDATFSPYLLSAYACKFQESREMAAASGPVRPKWESAPPEWLLEFIGDSRIFNLLSLMDLHESFCLDKCGILFGVNMAIRRTVLMESGGFNPEAFGGMWLGDGETGLNRKLWEKGLLIGYVPEALVYHHIPPERMTYGYLCSRMANEGCCAEYAYFHKEGIRGASQLLFRLLCLLVIFGPKLAVAGLDVIRRDRFARLKLRMCLDHHFSRIQYVARLLHDKSLRELVLREDWLSSS